MANLCRWVSLARTFPSNHRPISDIAPTDRHGRREGAVIMLDGGVHMLEAF